VAIALGELEAAALAAADPDDQDEPAGRWATLPIPRDPLLDAVDLHGAHDFRHTYATWLEDAGIPARVIDELMGHEANSRGQQRGSAMGAHYRHTTPEMHRSTAPTLLVAGGRDRFYTPELFRETADGIPGARMALYQNKGHPGVIAHKPAIREIVAFLRANQQAQNA
jgi:pimeloyl-ACP methyl ester carboxylesterase